MFSIVNATLLRPLPFPNPDRLVVLWEGKASNPDPDTFNIFSLPNYRDLKTGSRTLAEIALFDSTTGKLLKRATGSGHVKITSGVLSASSTIPAARGSGTFTGGWQAGRDRVVVLSYGGRDATARIRRWWDGRSPWTVSLHRRRRDADQFQFWSATAAQVPPGGLRRQTAVALVHLLGRMKPGGARADAQRGGHDRPRAAAANPDTQPDGTIRLEALAETGVTI